MGTAIVRKHEGQERSKRHRHHQPHRGRGGGADHHPDLTWTWRFLTISFTTHDAGGLTARDFHMANVVEDVLAHA
jgi:hypothetical protein